jgi:hypothetical protein
MTQDFYQSDTHHESGSEAEETLRLLARLPAPEGLNDRIHSRLEMTTRPARRSFLASIWSLWMPAQRLQFAGAALLVLAVAGSTWSVYHTSNRAGNVTPVPPAGPSTSFGSAGAERVPQTLKPIKVPPPPTKKTGPTHTTQKPSPKTLAAHQPAAHSNQ